MLPKRADAGGTGPSPCKLRNTEIRATSCSDSVEDIVPRLCVISESTGPWKLAGAGPPMHHTWALHATGAAHAALLVAHVPPAFLSTARRSPVPPMIWHWQIWRETHTSASVFGEVQECAAWLSLAAPSISCCTACGAATVTYVGTLERSSRAGALQDISSCADAADLGTSSWHQQ